MLLYNRSFHTIVSCKGYELSSSIMTSATTTSFYEITDKDMDGNVIPMSKYEGNVVLIVNVASY